MRDPNYSYTTKTPTPNRAEEDVELLHRPIPHPYIYLGLSLMGAGYAPLVYRAEAGIDVESTHAIFRIGTAYDNGHKVNDGNQPNPKGHDRYLETAAYYRMARGWFFGMGWYWSQLSTTNYSKGGNRPTIGGGYDLVMHPCDGCRRNLSARFTLDWVMAAGTDWGNGSRGPSITITLPASNEKRHLFLR